MKKPYLKMPVIYFDHYMLRTLKIQDAKDMFEYGKDAEVTQYLTWGPFYLEHEAKQSIKGYFLPRIKQGLPIGYAIVDTNTSKMIGTVDFHSKIKNENGAEIGYVLHKDYWNQGIMTQAVKALIQVGFKHLGYDFIRIKHMKKNIGSQKVIQKTGFVWVSTEPYTLEKLHEIIHDELLSYELLKEDYDGNEQGQRNI